MTPEDLELVADSVAPVVREYVTKALFGQTERMTVLEQRVEAVKAEKGDRGDKGDSVVGPQGLQGPPGKDVDPVLVAELKGEIAVLRAELAAVKQAGPNLTDLVAVIEKMVASQVATMPRPVDGKDGTSVTAQDVAPLVVAEVQKAVAGLPVPKDGNDGLDGRNGSSVTVEDVAPLIASQVQKAVATIPVPKDGKDGESGKDGSSVTVADVEPIVVAQVQKALAAIPAPKDGQNGKDGKDGRDGTSVTVEDVAPLVTGAVQKALGAMPTPKDGVGLMDAVLSRQGHLVLTLSDGGTRDVGLIVGKDADPSQIEKAVADAIAKIPTPKDGVDGMDGLGFDDMDVEYDGERTLTVKWSRGDRIKSKAFRLPVLLDRGKWEASKSYERGDVVSWDGAMWIAQGDTAARPGNGATAWRLSVKKGQDGRGLTGPQGPRGPKGGDGKDSWNS